MLFSKSNLALFQAIAESEVWICKPVIVRVCKSVKLDGIDCIGLYEDFHDYHEIRLSRSEIWTESELLATILHEYIHAWQAENDLAVNHSSAGRFPHWRKKILKRYALDINAIN